MIATMAETGDGPLTQRPTGRPLSRNRALRRSPTESERPRGRPGDRFAQDARPGLIAPEILRVGRLEGRPICFIVQEYMEVRLQKLLADAGIASRRASEQVILEGRVSVNGKVVQTLGTKVDPLHDRVSVDGRPVKPKRKLYLAVNKPEGYICSSDDPERRKTVHALLPKEWSNLHSVRRNGNLKIVVLCLPAPPAPPPLRAKQERKRNDPPRGPHRVPCFYARHRGKRCREQGRKFPESRFRHGSSTARSSEHFDKLMVIARCCSCGEIHNNRRGGSRASR